MSSSGYLDQPVTLFERTCIGNIMRLRFYCALLCSAKNESPTYFYVSGCFFSVGAAGFAPAATRLARERTFGDMAVSRVVFEVSIARGIGNNPILSVSLRPEINKQDYEIRRIGAS